MKKFLGPFLITTALYNSAYAANGQADDPVSDYSPVTSYEFSYFAEYGPVTLLDMLERIPDAKQVLDRSGRNNKRGFGSSGDQILIGGKRLSGKANNINDALTRISAGNVHHIELIRGAADGLDVQSDGLVINVVLEGGISTSTTFWSVGGVYYEGHDVNPVFTLSHSGSWNKLDYMIGVERKYREFHFDRDEVYLNGDRERTGELYVQGIYPNKSTAFTSNVTYNFEENGTLRLNGLYEPRTDDGEELRIESGLSPFYRRSIRDGDGNKWEVGGDYERPVGIFGQLKALFVVNRDKKDEDVNRFNAPDADFNYQTLATILNRSEKILRASLTKAINAEQSIEAGGEGAFNTYDQTFRQTSFVSDGVVDSIIANDTVEISERRYEAFANHNYTLNGHMALQSSLVAEFSTITADSILPGGGISRRETSFTFLKPRANLRYDLSASDQIRATAEKKVSQLDFRNFVTRFDNGTQQLRVGNTGIKPHEDWEFTLAYEHRFADDAGSLEIQLFHTRFKDFISNVDFSEYTDETGNPISADEFFALPPSDALRDATSFTAKSGNIDHATAYGVKLKSNIRLGFIGVPEAVVNVDYEYSTKNTTDQFTGEWRRFDRRSDHRLKLGYRHDVTKWKLAYGVNGELRSDYERFYINYYWPTSPYPELEAFAEMNIYDGIKARIEGNQLIGKRQNSTRFNYNDHIRFDDISRIDQRDTRTAQKISFSLQGTF